MANFADHITQAKSNLKFLEEISNRLSMPYWDWNVTVCYYVAVHLVNSHIAKVSDQHYRKHEEVSKALNPYFPLSPTKVPDNVYTAYSNLQNLSRRSRYLISDSMKNRSEDANLTYDKHFRRALVHLDTILEFISINYKQKFTTIGVVCIEARNIGLKHFEVA
jgi:hypothetical protein